MISDIDVFDDQKNIVGECPLWDDITGILYSLDFRGNTIKSTNLLTGEKSEVQLDKTTSCIALRKSGGLIAAMDDRLYTIHTDGSFELALLPTSLRGVRFNDGKVGPDGNFYVGTKGPNHSGALYRYGVDGSFTEMIVNLGSSNGIDWSCNGNKLYLCDSSDRTIYSYDFDIDLGSITNRKAIFSIDTVSWEPDGMCIDSEDMLWCAIWGAGCIYRIDPSSGKIIDTIRLPVSKTSSCTFIGKNLDTLVITTASIRTDMKLEPLAGKTFSVKPGVFGRRVFRFGDKYDLSDKK